MEGRTDLFGDSNGRGPQTSKKTIKRKPVQKGKKRKKRKNVLTLNRKKGNPPHVGSASRGMEQSLRVCVNSGEGVFALSKGGEEKFHISEHRRERWVTGGDWLDKKQL